MSAFGLYGQGVFAANIKAGRDGRRAFDYEQKDAAIRSFVRCSASTSRRRRDRDVFERVASAQVAYQLHRRPDAAAPRLGRGFKAGGFNPRRPLAAEPIDEGHLERSRAAPETTFAGGKATATATRVLDRLGRSAVEPAESRRCRGQFYIANVGAAETSGIELALTAGNRVADHRGCSVRSATRTPGSALGSVSSGVGVAGNTIPNTPDYRPALGAQLHQCDPRELHALRPGKWRSSASSSTTTINTRVAGGVLAGGFQRRRRAERPSRGAVGEERIRQPLLPRRVRYGQLAPSGFIARNRPAADMGRADWASVSEKTSG